MSLEGKATTEGTRRYFERLGDLELARNGATTLGSTGLHASRVGFGGYRVHAGEPEHRRALEHALLHGVNVIDTSSNYTDGGSEGLIGEVLGGLVGDGRLRRDEVLVVSKGGYIQGKVMELCRTREAEGRGFPDVVKYADDCWHCIHPEFLETQLAQSLERLKLKVIDVYLLHNPEYFLMDAKQRRETEREAVRKEYYRRIGAAFEWLEGKVESGVIGAYGVSSNTFVESASVSAFTSLERVVAAAEGVSPRHRFRVIQFPLNIFETGAVVQKNQRKRTKTLVEAAREAGLATLVNRPLNAASGQSMIRLADFRETDPRQIDREFGERRSALAAAEQRFRDEFLPHLPPAMPREHLDQVFRLSDQFSLARASFGTWEQWDQIRQYAVEPKMRAIVVMVQPFLRERASWEAWSREYDLALEGFLDVISRHYENAAQGRSKSIGRVLDERAPGVADSSKLAQKCLRVLCSTPGIDCVLLGMRRLAYVEDALAAMRHPPLADTSVVFAETASA